MSLRPQITPTIQHTTPTDIVPGIDVYGEGRTTPINGIVDKLPSSVVGFLKASNGLTDEGKLNKVGILKNVAKLTGLMTGDPDRISKFKSDLKGSGRDLLRNIGSGAVTQILANNGITGNTGAIVDAAFGVPGSKPLRQVLHDKSPLYRVIMNSDVKKIIDGDYDNLTELSQLLSNVTGESNFASLFELGEYLAPLNYMVETARSMYLPEVLDIALGDIKLVEDKRLFLLMGATSAAKGSDLSYMQKAVELCGKGAILEEVPNIDQLMLSGFKIPRDHDGSTNPINGHISFIDDMKPGWENSTRDGQVIGNLGSFSSASDDAITCLLKMERFIVKASIARSYQSIRIETLSSQRYPISMMV